jgi:putative DNA primase/helicase
MEPRLPAPARDLDPLEPEHLSDTGNAKRLVRRFGEDIRYVRARRDWLVWCGTHWERDTTGQVERYAKQVAAEIYIEAGYEVGHDARRRDLARHAAASESLRGIRGMVELAHSEPGISVDPGALDTDPWLLNVSNGTLDLRTGVLGPHDRAHLMTKLVPVPYDPTATCPTFVAFLNRIFRGDAALIDFVQRAAGYSLTGDTRAQVLFLLWGQGANGKTTLVQAVAGILSDYAATLAADTLLARKGDAGLVLNDLATLQGARFVAAMESDMGRRFAESLVKQLTGGEPIKVKRLYQDVYSFVPTFKLWVSTNHRPVIRGTDHAMWRRVRLLPFEEVIPDGEQDPALPDKLRAERAGILAWAVAGCRAYLRDGLTLPAPVRKATAAYRRDMDTLGDFLADCCIVAPDARVTSAALYATFTDWARAAGEAPLSSRELAMRLHDAPQGFHPEKVNRARGWKGLRLREAGESPPDDDGED